MAHGSRPRPRRFGPGVKERFEFGATVDREHAACRGQCAASPSAPNCSSMLGNDGFLVLPTVPGRGAAEERAASSEMQAYRERALRLLCLSGLSGFPQITLPLGKVDGAPFGISLLGPPDSDMALIRLGRRILEAARKGLNRMDTLTRMRAFIDVVEAEGFSAAARKIGRSKALLSKYVRELEDELGALLLNRTTRQFSLTEAGHTYYKRASEIVREVDSLADAVRESSGDVRGRIKLSAPRTFADAPIGQSLIDFAKAHPDIVLEIHLDDRFVDLVEEGFDLGDPHHPAGELVADRAAAGALLGAGLRLARADRQARQADAAAGPRPLPCIIDTNGRWLSNWPFIGDNGETGQRFGLRADRGQQPAGGARRRRSGLGFAILPDFIAAPDDRDGPAGAGARRPDAEGRRHLRRLSAPPLSAGQGARLRRFPGAVVQEIPVPDEPITNRQRVGRDIG